MSNQHHDSGDSMDNMPAVRARVPEHVAKGEISTGVIVVTGATEFVLDFVRNLPRPSTIVARVVLPHGVMPQFIEALAKNIELFRQRYGELPGTQQPAIPQVDTHHAPSSQETGQGQPASNPSVAFHAFHGPISPPTRSRTTPMKSRKHTRDNRGRKQRLRFYDFSPLARAPI